MLSNLLYLDVAAFSAVTSAVAAIGVAIAAPILYWWKKTKKGVCKALHIDENKNKEVEEELILSEDFEETQADEQTAEEAVEEIAEESSAEVEVKEN